MSAPNSWFGKKVPAEREDVDTVGGHLLGACRIVSDSDLHFIDCRRWIGKYVKIGTSKYRILYAWTRLVNGEIPTSSDVDLVTEDTNGFFVEGVADELDAGAFNFEVPSADCPVFMFQVDDTDETTPIEESSTRVRVLLK